MNKFLLIISTCFFLANIQMRAQNKYIPPDPYTQWDGITHRSRYMIVSPAYFGPNALPVPELHQARVPERFLWKGMYEYYFNPGDQTHDFLTHFVIPVGNRRVGLEFKYVPVEYFRMDSIVSRERRTLSGKAAEGYSLGDIYFGTMVQLIKDQGYIPDVMISLACRTASGTSRDYARYTDMPGYYFDVSIGDSFGRAAGFFRSVRWYGEVGFYVYQTFLDNYPQNDALLYGIGFDLDFSLFYLNQSIRGYNGYMYNGDHPLVYRADFGFKFGSAALVVGYEKGIRDFPFESIRAGFQINGLSEKEE